MQCAWNCQKVVLRWFYNYGYFLGNHPFWFLIIPPLICGGLAVGFMYMDPVDDIEYLYSPISSRAIDDREVVKQTFQNSSSTDFDPFSQTEIIQQSEVIFRSIDEKSIFTDSVLLELNQFLSAVVSVTADVGGGNISYQDVCKKINGTCAISGGFVFDNTFRQMLKNGSVTFPWWSGLPGIDLSFIFGNVNEVNGTLTSAGSLKLTFPLEKNQWSRDWEVQFLKLSEKYNLTTARFAYSTSRSLTEELDKGTKGDTIFFMITFTLMITFASMVSSGGDIISSRALLADAGVVAVVFGILGAFGLVTLCGVHYVNLVGMMPFLVLGIGVDDMFLLMSSWSETLAQTDLTIPERMGRVYKSAGIGITITSVTDFLAFVIGASSIFRSVRNFSIYTGVAVILCYFCNACMFGACLTLHGRRVYSSRHLITCQKVDKTRDQLKEEGKNCCQIIFCGGKVPSRPDDDQSIWEIGPRKALVKKKIKISSVSKAAFKSVMAGFKSSLKPSPSKNETETLSLKFLLWNPVRYVTLLVFAGYLGVAIWGCTKLKQGLELKNLAPESSYFYTFQSWRDEDFGIKLPIALVTTTTRDYRDNQTLKNIADLLDTAKKDPLIDGSFSRCWLTSLSSSRFYNTTSEGEFLSGLNEFLQFQPEFFSDVVFSADMKSITASRCYVYSTKVSNSNEQADLMSHIRDIADTSPAAMFAYNPAFVYYEQYVVILSSTLQTVGVTMAVMFVATSIFLPHPLMVCLVMVQVVMIVVGIIGFMAHWDLTLSSVTMIDLIMSVGFSVDFCAHVCTAYMVSEASLRHERAKEAIVHASSPIFNGGLSSLIGIVVLLFTNSYIFQSFFKIMFLVITFGVLHAVFLVPVILSFIGPRAHARIGQDSPPGISHAAAINGSIPLECSSDGRVSPLSISDAAVIKRVIPSECARNGQYSPHSTSYAFAYY